jgi:hypothetical protein
MFHSKENARRMPFWMDFRRPSPPLTEGPFLHRIRFRIKRERKKNCTVSCTIRCRLIESALIKSLKSQTGFYNRKHGGMGEKRQVRQGYSGMTAPTGVSCLESERLSPSGGRSGKKGVTPPAIWSPGGGIDRSSDQPSMVRPSFRCLRSPVTLSHPSQTFFTRSASFPCCRPCPYRCSTAFSRTSYTPTGT